LKVEIEEARFVMRNLRNRRSVGAALLVLFFALAGQAQESQIGKLTGDAKRGKALYERFCIFCHGAEGDGAGVTAPYIDPKPRDFTKATYKCRSTPSGNLPLDIDLYDTITRGVHASGMPSWRPLTRQNRVDLVAYVKSFSPRFHEEPAAAAITIPPEPPSSPESVKRGGELFQSMNCWACHGKGGHGNGPTAATLTDSNNNPIRPFDLTSGTQLKCGDSDTGIFRDLSTGLDGTPMPSFSSALKPDQMWDLVHYIATLRDNAKHHVPEPKAQAESE
jgi:mono/diheme cytochrome c family protein